MLIDPEVVYQAYQKHNIRPKRGPRNDSTECCCALDILHLELEGKWKNRNLLSEWASPKYGDYFTSGFWAGFDGAGKDWHTNKQYDDGYKNGVEVRKYLTSKGYSL